MPIINSVLSWLMKKRIHQIELFIKYPHEIQEEWFFKLLDSAKNTEFGLKYDFKSINNVWQFKERIPLSNYESFKPYIDRLRSGEQNIIWPTEIKWFAKSSGTTNSKSKYIPVSQEAIEECHFKGGKDLLSIYCNNNPETLIFDGRAIAIGGSQYYSGFNNEAYYGDISSIIIKNLPFWAQFIRTPNKSITLSDEWESKIEKMAVATANQNITNISGVPSWTLLLLQKVLEITNCKYISEIWPNFELFIHGGVCFSPYRKQFQELINNDNVKYIDTYNATEGFFGIQDRNNLEDMLLMLDYGIYYEFLPLNQINSDHTKTLSLYDVKINTNYAIIISNNSGLWRYMIGDTIVFTSLNPFRFKITGRTKAFINAFGEELIEDNANKALDIACNKSNAIINEYTAAPIYFSNSEKASHEWLIEFKKEPENINYFIELLDNALKSLNSDYEAKRYKDMILNTPIVKTLPKNTFYKWLKTKNKLGGQNKILRLSNDRDIVDEILKQLK